ncbi:kinase [uncultured Sphingomonas sp.]|uniref:kinase n=1 Tax=uncultured Sphingomonas sp. TaxID=158754 RepID=UPI0025F002BD|nr:kinase [uncultured Sphingomonas sp.]
MSPEAILTPIVAEALARAAGRPLVIGICGAQGSGKSTLAASLSARFDDAPVLSIDDLYLGRDARQRLAAEVHPLFATRGVPGTHDAALGLELIARFRRGEPLSLPRFDKATDDRADGTEPVPAGAKLLLFEGWCLGAQPAAVDGPINGLERDEDPDGRWRARVEAALAGPYAALFAQIDLLIFLAAPSFETVADWRWQQEAALAAARPGAAAVMSRGEVDRFVVHYERITRRLLADLPGRADVTLWLDADRRCVRITQRGVGETGSDDGR